jgi:hypothetical protein
MATHDRRALHTAFCSTSAVSSPTEFRGTFSHFAFRQSHPKDCAARLSVILPAQQEQRTSPVISSRVDRLTKNLLLAAAALLCQSTWATEPGCGPARGASNAPDERATIALQNLDRQGPVYYWHDSSTYALLYFRPEDLVARLEALLASENFGDDSIGPALLDNIRVDLPLKESTDLFRYTLIDQRFDSVVNSVLADLLKDGKVMLDKWIFADDPSRSIVMVSRSGKDGQESERWFCTRQDEVLFRIG